MIRWEPINRGDYVTILRSDGQTVQEKTFKGWLEEEKRPPTPYPDEIPWKLPSGRTPAEPETIERTVYEFIENHVELPNPRYYSALTGWAIATWLKERWQNYPYLYFLGPRGTGKTRALEVLEQIARRAVLVASVTGPTLFRTIDQYDVCYLIDEARVLKGIEREEARDVILRGWHKGAVVPRLVGAHHKVRYFKCGSFKAFGSVLTPFSPQLDDRSIVINTVKARPKRKRIDREKAGQIRNALLEIRVNERPAHNPYWADEETTVEASDPRIEDLFAPLKTSLHGEETRRDLDELVEEVEERRREEIMAEEDAEYAQALVEIARTGEAKVHYASLRTGDDNPRSEGRRIGWFAKRHGLKRGRDPKGTYIDIRESERELKHLAERYELDLGMQVRK